MRRLMILALALVPVLANAQAVQTSTATAAQSSAPQTTLQAKNTAPAGLHPAAAPRTASANVSLGSPEIMVPVHQIVSDNTISTSEEDSVASTAPRLLQSTPLQLSLRDMEAQANEASVVLHLTVDLLGMPRNITVTRSGGDALDKRALDAVRQYRFKPAIQNNVPVEMPVDVEIKVKKS